MLVRALDVTVHVKYFLPITPAGWRGKLGHDINPRIVPRWLRIRLTDAPGTRTVPRRESCVLKDQGSGVAGISGDTEVLETHSEKPACPPAACQRNNLSSILFPDTAGHPIEQPGNTVRN